MPEIPLIKPVLQKIDFPSFSKYGVQLEILRLDQMHKDLGGNKWFKLKRNIKKLKELNNPKVLSFGGAYSNHLRALSAVGNIFSFKTIGLVRGEIIRPLNPVLTFAESNGMELYGLSRDEYRLKDSKKFLLSLRNRFGDFFLLPEGGGNQAALLGCKEIACHINSQPEGRFRYISLACGTGVTLAGITLGSSTFQRTQILGVSVLNAPGYLSKEVKSYIRDYRNGVLDCQFSPWKILDQYHCGGYAKTNRDLLDFCNTFIKVTGVPIEPVYTGKMLYGLAKQVDLGLISPGQEILAIHTGGVN